MPAILHYSYLPLCISQAIIIVQQQSSYKKKIFFFFQISNFLKKNNKIQLYYIIKVQYRKEKRSFLYKAVFKTYKMGHFSENKNGCGSKNYQKKISRQILFLIKPGHVLTRFDQTGTGSDII